MAVDNLNSCQEVNKKCFVSYIILAQKNSIDQMDNYSLIYFNCSCVPSEMFLLNRLTARRKKLQLSFCFLQIRCQQKGFSTSSQGSGFLATRRVPNASELFLVKKSNEFFKHFHAFNQQFDQPNI